MTRFHRKALFPPLAIVLCLGLAVPGPSWAAFIPFSPPDFPPTPAGGEMEGGGGGEADTAAALALLRSSLENELIAGRLLALGVSREEAEERLAGLSSEERGLVASRCADIQAGGDVQVFVTFSGVVSGPLLLGLLFLWMMVFAFDSGS